MKITKVISTIMSAVICTSCFTYTANSKVIEPEVVKTESWSTSYYIDDDIDTLYPYIQCEADIYNDGTIKLYMWNTHEWDGFATVKHRVTILPTSPVSDTSMLYCFNKDIPYVEYGYTYIPISEEDYKNKRVVKTTLYENMDVSYYPDKYQYSGGYTGVFHRSFVTNDVIYSYRYGNNFDIGVFHTGNYIFRQVFDGSLCSLTFSDHRDYDPYNYNNKCHVEVFIPNEDPTGTYNFRLYGHDITITPELLSGNITAEPELTDQDKYIKQLEEENAKLKEEVNSYKSLDSDTDGMLTANDAQMILNYYGEYMSGNVSGKVEDYQKFIENFKETS